MKDLLFNQLIRKSTTQSESLTKLNLVELWTLLNIYNKRYVEYMVEYSRHFDLYENDFHGTYTNLFKQLGSKFDVSVLNSIEKNTIFSQTSSSFFYNEIVEREEVNNFLNLVEAGFFSFMPLNEGVALAENFYFIDKGRLVRKDFEDYFFRSDLNSYPIFFHLPIEINIPKNMAELHFKKTNPRYQAYLMAIDKANSESVSIKRLNDVFIILLLLDNVLIHFLNIVKDGMKNHLNIKFNEFLDIIDCSKLLDKVSFSEQQQILMYSKINSIVGWIFNCNHLKRQERLDFIKLLSSGRKNNLLITNFIRENHIKFNI